MKKIFLLLAIFFFCLLLNTNNASASTEWWNTSFKYRRQINITSTQAVNDYQVFLNITYDSDMQPDFDDLRFTDNNNNELPYWIEQKTDGVNAYVWVKANLTNGNTTIWMYYGNSEVSNKSNLYATCPGGYDSITGLKCLEYYSYFTSEEIGKWYTYNDLPGNTSNDPFGPTNDSAYSCGTASGLNLSVDGDNFWIDRACPWWWSNQPRWTYREFQNFGDAYLNISFYRRFGYYISGRGNGPLKIVIGNDKTGATGTKIYEEYYSGGAGNPGPYVLKYANYSSPLNNFYLTIRMDTGDIGWSIDAIRIKKYITPEPTYTIGSEEEWTNEFTITINSPQNITYFDTSITFNFSATHPTQNIFSLVALLDGTEIYSNNNYQNNTQVVFTQELTQAKTYNLTIIADNTATRTRFFTIKDFEFETVEYNSNTYETEYENFSIIYKVNFDLINNITTSLFYNSTEYTQTSQQINSTHIKNTISFYIPFVSSNNTNVNFYFYSTIKYQNSTETYHQTTAQSQNILLAYYVNSISLDKANYTECDYIIVTYNLTTLKTNALANATSTFNSITKSNSTYPSSQTTILKIIFENPPTESTSETREITRKVVFKFGSNEKQFDYSNLTFDSYRMSLKHSSSTEIYSHGIAFYLKDEANPLYYISIAQLQVYVNYTNAENACIERSSYIPYSISYYGYRRPIYVSQNFMKLNITYLNAFYPGNDTYRPASYYAYSIFTLNNSTPLDVILYTSKVTDTTPIVFTLPDENYIINVEVRNENNYVFLRNERSDFNRNAILYLVPYTTYYRIMIFTDNYELCFQSSEFRITQSSYTISSCNVPASSVIPTAIYERNINATCSFDNSTFLLSCDFYALDSMSHNVTLYVYRTIRPFGLRLFGTDNIYSVSGSVSLMLESGYLYEYILISHNTYEYLRGQIDLTEEVEDENINFFVFLISLVCVVFAFINPFISLFVTILVMFVLSSLNIASFTTTALSSLIILFAIAMILLRRR